MNPRILCQIRAIIEAQSVGVLATCGENGPHVSLMAFACSGDLREFYLMTPRSTRKWANLQANPRASLLIDNRCLLAGAPLDVAALGVYGHHEPLSSPALEAKARELLLARAKRLASLAGAEDSALIRLKVERLQFQQADGQAHFIEFHPDGNDG